MLHQLNTPICCRTVFIIRLVALSREYVPGGLEYKVPSTNATKRDLGYIYIDVGTLHSNQLFCIVKYDQDITLPSSFFVYGT